MPPEEYGARVEKGDRILRIPVDALGLVRVYAENGYPYEVCGALLGSEIEGQRIVSQVLPLENELADGRRERYAISPEKIILVQKEGKRLGLDLLGFYHSHPDHPAKPSECDWANSWPWYSYLIMSVIKGNAQEISSWELKEDRSSFLSQKLEIVW